MASTSDASTATKRTSKSVDNEISKWTVNLVQPSSLTVSNGCLLNLLNLNKTPTNTCRQFSELVGYAVDIDKFKSQLRNLSKLYKDTKKNPSLDSYWEQFLSVINAKWDIVRQRDQADVPKKRKSPPPPEPAKKKPSKRLRNDCPKCPVLQEKIQLLNASITKLKDNLSKKTSRVQFCNSEIRRLNALNRSTKTLRLQSDRALAYEKKNVEKEKDEKAEKALECKRLTEKLKNKNATMKRIRLKKNSYYNQLRLKNKDPIEQSNKLKIEKRNRKRSDKKVKTLEASIVELKKKVKSLQKEVQDDKIYIDDLLCTINSPDKDATDKEAVVHVREFKPDVRRVIYEAIHSKVPIANASRLIGTAVTKLSSSIAPVLPSPSTISRMSAELGVISYVQAAETILNSENQATLAWDATTLGGVHVNEVHIQTTEQTLTIAIDALPGGTAPDYVSHISGVIDNMADIYSDYKKLNPVTVKTTIIRCIGSTCTDRASVNSVVVRELRDLWKTDLVELHCNLHPLDSFARKIREGLKVIDEGWELRGTGRDCRVANFLYGLSKLKIDETGDPAGFTSWLIEHGIPSSKVIRYVGNKWNVLFWMPSFVLECREMLSEYLQKFCRTDHGLRTDLLWALTNDRILTELRALALIGKVITTPWMEEFYGNSKRLSNLEMVPMLKIFSSKLEEFVSDPTLLFSTRESIFGEKLATDGILLWLQDSLPSDDLLTCLNLMLSCIKEVSDRQLHRYTKGELSKITPELLEATKASTPHNVWAERTLGSLNALWDRAKQASIAYLEKKVITASNHLMAYLDSLDVHTMNALISFAVRKGAIYYKKSVQRRKELRVAAAKKTRLVGQKRDMEKRKEMQKSVAGALKSNDARVIEELKDDDLYRSLKEAEQSKIDAILKGGSLKGECIYHDWLEDDGKTETYHGDIITTVPRSNGLLSYRIKYWLPGLKEESLSTNNIQAEKFVVDILLGDLRVRQ